ncbi:tRNA-intron endonuclease catalytic domain-like protein [Heliocybe sulcata]|uniref:tRNA-splicing endonuclease subunit Sen2 n=1 Tax=Heliocybe sulcata TaxID=5364 RepID=A0A5C3N5B8_9AGAM|nr:tRNA-intron endonuclease catalytic domain-like protein [Heliocybe sulcata]
MPRKVPLYAAHPLLVDSFATDMVSEQVTANRRAERKQFKLDRARAIAQAAEAAEAAFKEGRVLTVEETGIVIPSAATWKPSRSSSPPPPLSNGPPTSAAQKDQPLDEDIPENLEHLQLTLQEAFFLLWTLDCLTVVDPNTNCAMTLQQIWQRFQQAHLPPYPSHPADPTSLRFDNPFLINYVVYHHYRSLGWVIRNGIKFCVDYLLYKRGPVFHHAEFALVVCPVYEDEDDRQTCPFDLQNVDPFSWTWLSTVNRVNSQVQKTLVLTYVTIPARSRCNAELLASPACLQYFSIREVVLRRFIPARMRD